MNRPLLAAVALSFAGSLLPATTATAAPVCNLLTDAAGDVTSAGQTVGDDNVDIISADIAAGAKQVVAVVRVAKLANWDPMSGPLGNRTYTVQFTVGADKSARLLQITGFSALDGVAPNFSYAFGHLGPDGQAVVDGAATGAFDLTAGTVTISAPTTAWAKAKLNNIIKRRTISKLHVIAQTHFVNGDSYGIDPVNTTLLNPARLTDEASSTAKYVVGTASCVPAP